MNLPKRKFAIQGGKAAFSKTALVNQLSIPNHGDFEHAFRDIFSRRYYTNQGPLATLLEERLSNFFGVKHVICMTNATIAMVISAKALNLQNKVICSGFTFAGVTQSLSWAGVEPLCCDIDSNNHQISLTQLELAIDHNVSGIFASHLWGYPCSPVELQHIADKHNVKLYFDASHAFGCSYEDKNIAQYGELSVFSFDALSILNSAEGGCVTTNCDKLAARLRNIRSRYGAGEPVEIPLTGNGRMSEAQAAMALLSLNDYHKNMQHNKSLFNTYLGRLSGIPGLKVLTPDNKTVISYSYLVLTVTAEKFGMNRDRLVAILKAENIDCHQQHSPEINTTISYNNSTPVSGCLPATEQLSEMIMHLPIGAQITIKDVTRVCEIIFDVHNRSIELSGVVI